jgi:(2Fe-2S) ferredoxin
MLVYVAGSEAVWYAHVGPGDVAQLVDQHLLDGGPPIACIRHAPIE